MPSVPFWEPDGDVVPGDPPVPITVWYLPQPSAGTVVSAAFVRRLAANYTRPGAAIVDLTTPGVGERRAQPVDLVVTSWPAGSDTTADRHLADCVVRLACGGCLAVVLPVTQTPGHLGDLVTAARAAGLTYLQHVVIAHQLTADPADRADREDRAAEPLPEEPGQPRWTPHHRVHSDVLVFLRRGEE